GTPQESSGSIPAFAAACWPVVRPDSTPSLHEALLHFTPSRCYALAWSSFRNRLRFLPGTSQVLLRSGMFMIVASIVAINFSSPPWITNASAAQTIRVLPDRLTAARATKDSPFAG